MEKKEANLYDDVQVLHRVARSPTMDPRRSSWISARHFAMRLRAEVPKRSSCERERSCHDRSGAMAALRPESDGAFEETLLGDAFRLPRALLRSRNRGTPASAACLLRGWRGSGGMGP